LFGKIQSLDSSVFFSTNFSSSKEYDVVIAGGGVMGCSVAYHLASASNLSVAVVEKDPAVGETNCTWINISQ
jgi:flavin-dependent dehydrogenase